MPAPPQPGDHYVLMKLYAELLPWIIKGRAAKRRWFVHAATIYAFGGEIATTMTGLGVGAPVVAVFNGKPAADQNAFDVIRTQFGAWFWVGIAALAIWIALRITVSKSDATAKALYAKDCARGLSRLHADLYTALAAPNPMPRIAQIQEAVMRKVDEAIDKGVWPCDPPPPPHAEIKVELDAEIDHIRRSHMAGWAPPPAGAQ